MSNKFLGTSDINVSDGSSVLYGSSLGASNLKSGFAIKINASGNLYSTNLEISDVNLLSGTLATIVTHSGANPVDGELTAYSGTLGDEIKSSGVNTSDVFLRTGTIPMTGNIDLDSTYTINNLITPVSDFQASTKKYVDDQTSGTGDFKSDGTVAMTQPIKAIDGKETTPAYAFNTDLNAGMWNDAGDVVISSAGVESLRIGQNTSVAGKLIMNNTLINTVANPVSAQDAATKAYVDTATDGVVIGPASTTDNRLCVYDGNTGKLVKDSLLVALGGSLDSVGLAPFSIGGSTAIRVDLGSTTTETKILGGLDMFSKKITNLLDPTADQDGATKAYVDTATDGVVIGPSSSVSSNLCSFNGTTGKLIQNSGISAIGGNIDQSSGAPLKLGGLTAQSVDIGASGIDTNILGDAKVDGSLNVGWYEPRFIDDPILVNSTMTVSGRTISASNASGYRFVISPDTFETGITTTDQKLIVQITALNNSSLCFFLMQKHPILFPPTSYGAETFVALCIATFGNSFVPIGGTGIPGGSETYNNLGAATLSTNDFIEMRLTNSCQDWNVYYHGVAVGADPLLLYTWEGLNASGKWHWQIGDGNNPNSTFTVKTVEYGNDLNISGDVYIERGLNVFDTTDIDITATSDNHHGVDIKYDAAGFSDSQALEINYTTGALAATEEDDAIIVSVDKTLSTGGEIVGLAVLSTEGSAETWAIESGVQVGPLIHLVGSFENGTIGLVNAVDKLSEFNGATLTSVFVADNDTITTGFTSKFSEIEILLSTGANRSVNPTYEFSTGVGTWQAFSPSDTTNGFRNTGIVAWLADDVGSWAVSGSDYLIRITRTRNNLSTTPIVSKLQISTAIEYSWDKNADVTCNTVDATTSYSVAGTKILGAQGAAVADATDAATAISQLNILLARCRAHGIIDV